MSCWRLTATTNRILRTTGPAYNAMSVAFWVKIATGMADYAAPRFWGARTSGYEWYSTASCTIYPAPYAGLKWSIFGSGGSGTSAGDYGIEGMVRDEWYYVAASHAGNGTGGNILYVWDDTGTLLETLSYTGSGSGTLAEYNFMRFDGDATLGKIGYGRVWSRVLTQANFEAEQFSPSVVGTTDIYSAFEADPATDTSGQSHPWTLTGGEEDTGDTPPVILTVPDRNAAARRYQHLLIR